MSIRQLFLGIIFLMGVNTISGQKPSPRQMDQLISDQLKQTLITHREFVSIPNDAAFPEDMNKNIAWLKAAFEKVDFSVQVLETGSIPLVFAQNKPKSKNKTILFYLHMDGQSVDPALWDQKHPFEPVLK
ncbi:MAG: acetylornithine deacetylase, partial [Bacteroidetes bacterium]|nr:acetylornithine deacetylase [Bacteroidota bacterium]